MQLTGALGASRPTPRTLEGWGAEARRWALLAVLIVGAMIPWYTLSLVPLLTVGTAKVNLLDTLVACAVLLSGPVVVTALRRGEWEILSVFLFLAYMTVAFALGLARDPHARFFAVRESRGLAFYALAAVFAVGGYATRDFHRFAVAYVVGTVVAVVAVFAHVVWHAPLPGYPAMIASTPSAQADVIARYLEWTVPVVAFTICLAGVLSRTPLRTRAAWAVGLCCIVWYLIAMHERTAEGVALAVAVTLGVLPSLGGLTWRRVAIMIAMLAFVIGLGVVPGPHWIHYPAERMLGYWGQLARDDGSVRVRINELESALPRFLQSPVLGQGLGTVVADEPPDFHTGEPWRYIAPGYGYLLVKTGLIGLVLYLGMVGLALRRAWRYDRAGREAEGWPRWTIATVGMGALLALNLADPSVDTAEGAIAFSLFFGMLVAPELNVGAPDRKRWAKGRR